MFIDNFLFFKFRRSSLFQRSAFCLPLVRFRSHPLNYELHEGGGVGVFVILLSPVSLVVSGTQLGGHELTASSRVCAPQPSGDTARADLWPARSGGLVRGCALGTVGSVAWGL